MKVLVTGGLGFIGHHLIARLRAVVPSAEITAFDAQVDYAIRSRADLSQRRRWRESQTQKEANVIVGDLCNAAEIEAAVRVVEPTHVVHLACVPIATLADERPVWAASMNVGGTVNLLDALERSNAPVRRIVFFSSSFVYGHFEMDPIDELSRCAPINLYGSSKLVCEHLVRASCERAGFECVVVRPSAVYGPGDTNGRVIQRFVEAAVTGEPLRVRSDASALDFTYVTDVATGATLAVTVPGAAGEVFNVTAGKARTLDEVVDLLRARFPQLRTEDVSSQGKIPRRGQLDIGRARQVLGYEPRFTLEAGLLRYLDEIGAGSRSEPTMLVDARG